MPFGNSLLKKKKKKSQICESTFVTIYPKENNTTCLPTLIIFVQSNEKITENSENLEIKIYNEHIDNKYLSLMFVLTNVS